MFSCLEGEISIIYTVILLIFVVMNFTGKGAILLQIKLRSILVVHAH